MKLLASTNSYNIYPFREDKYQVTNKRMGKIGVFNTLTEAVLFATGRAVKFVEKKGN